VQTAHSKFNKNVWVTELGITSASNPTQSQSKSFMISAFSWMDSQSYVERAAWFGKSNTFLLHPGTIFFKLLFTSLGAFESGSAPDGFASSDNALFKPGGQLSDMGLWYA
jgi:hypothetical protein